ncbi:MAG: hypothetical protein SVR94_17910, partial [Pseudomonadota bacterium]|nr:hypothetical protein [Pseudomonadota bacterium]
MNNISKVYSSYEQVPTYRKHTKPFLTLTITLLLLLTGNSRAENQLIEDIRAYYYPLSEAIEIAKGDDEDEEETPSSLKEERSVEHGESFGELYSTEIFFNSNNMTTCGAGHVDKKIIFWYSKQWPDQPKPKPL